MPTKSKDPFWSGMYSLSLCFLLGLSLFAFWGKYQAPQVHSIGEEAISPATTQLFFEFTQSMNQESVESAFQIDPQRNGQLSFLGKRLVWTAAETLGYGTKLEVRFAGKNNLGVPMDPQVFEVQTREPEITFVDSNGVLQLMNLNTQEQKALSPEGKEVLQYQWDAQGQKLAFLTDSNEGMALHVRDINSQKERIWWRSRSDLALDFVFAPNGQSLLLDVVERDPKTQVPGLQSLWHISPLRKKRFWYPGLNSESIHFSPDSSYVLGLDLSEAVLLPLTPSSKAPQFLGTFARTFGFDSSGTKALFVEGNRLLQMNQNGDIETLYQGLGEVQQAQFTPKGSVFFSVFLLEENRIQVYRWDESQGLKQIASYTGPAYTWALDPIMEKIFSLQDAQLEGSALQWRP